MSRYRTLLAVLTAVVASGCAALPGAGLPQQRVSLPLNRAWMDGQPVEYLTTDISDPTLARALGVNLAPRLAQAVAAPGKPSLVDRVYKFADDAHITVFQSAASPTGAANQDASYSPL